MPKRTKLRNVMRARKHLADLGIPLPVKPPKMQLRLPHKLDALPTSQVTQQMNRWAQYLEYVRVQATEADIRHREAEDHYKKDRAIAFVRIRSDQPKQVTAAEINARIDTNTKFVKMSDMVEVLDAKRRLLETIVESGERNYAMLSRELTRRTNSSDRRVDT